MVFTNERSLGGAGHSLSRIATVRAQNLGDNPDAMVLVAIGFVIALSSQSSGTPPTSQSSDKRTWYVAYEDARKAIDQKNWTARDRQPRACRVAPDRSPARNVRTYGNNYLTFIPDYYLGVAYLNLGRFAEADAAFERARNRTC